MTGAPLLDEPDYQDEGRRATPVEEVTPATKAHQAHLRVIDASSALEMLAPYVDKRGAGHLAQLRKALDDAFEWLQA